MIYSDMSEIPKGKHGVIYADPAWTYSSFSEKGKIKSAEMHYTVSPLQVMMDMPVKELGAKDCHLFMWCTWPNLFQAKDLMNAWGFEYSASGFIWFKLRKNYDTSQISLVGPSEKDTFYGLGHTTRKNTEICLLGRRGSPRRLSKAVAEVMFQPITKHSAKPLETYRRIERYSSGPYLELFSRNHRKNWDMWGNEAGKFNGNDPVILPTLKL